MEIHVSISRFDPIGPISNLSRSREIVLAAVAGGTRAIDDPIFIRADNARRVSPEFRVLNRKQDRVF